MMIDGSKLTSYKQEILLRVFLFLVYNTKCIPHSREQCKIYSDLCRILNFIFYFTYPFHFNRYLIIVISPMHINNKPHS